MIIRWKKDSLPVFSSMMDNFFDVFDSSNSTKEGSSLPAVNLKENNKEFIVELAAPGLKKDDFKIELENNQLAISSEVEQKVENTIDKYSRKEFCYDSFKRTFTFPDTADFENTSANYLDGILTVVVQKKEETIVKPKREIIID